MVRANVAKEAVAVVAAVAKKRAVLGKVKEKASVEERSPGGGEAEKAVPKKEESVTKEEAAVKVKVVKAGGNQGRGKEGEAVKVQVVRAGRNQERGKEEEAVKVQAVRVEESQERERREKGEARKAGAVKKASSINLGKAKKEREKDAKGRNVKVNDLS